MKTRMTEILGIKYPIMQGGMQHLGVPALAAAVSNAGGLGTINVTNYPVIDDFRKAVQEVKRLTPMPFCVNISLLPHVSLDNSQRNFDYIDVCAEEKVPVIETAGRNPLELVPAIKERGIKLIHKVPMARHAQTAEEIGADLVSIIGYEAAGHPSMAEIGTMTLGRQTARKVSIPVILGGGIADGHGLAAALALGAEGVLMGTRFVATEECPIHPNFKEWMVQATESDTVTIQRTIGHMARVAKNDAALACLEMEKQGASLEELMSVISGSISKQAYIDGEVDTGLFSVGTAVGLIDEVLPVATLIDEMVTTACRLKHKKKEN